MSIKKLKKMCCRVLGAETFNEIVVTVLAGTVEVVFFAWMINDMINTLVARGY